LKDLCSSYKAGSVRRRKLSLRIHIIPRDRKRKQWLRSDWS